MPNGKYRILTRRHLAAALALLFLAAVLMIVAAAAIPYAYANAVAAARQKRPICCTDRADRVVSVTFDAVRGDGDIRELVDVLAQYGVKATFFVTGEWVERCADEAKALHDAGHEVMNHSDTHLSMAGLPRADAIREISACSDKIQAVTGERPALFRAPRGDYDDALIETAEMLGMSCIQWDVESRDGLSAEESAREVLSRVSSGSIVRFRAGGENTAQALAAVLRSLQNEGYRFLTVSEMIYTENYTVNQEGRQISLED
ncbi:MAG TPA: polysaccharide deacetylase family protein [Firmicutes bacterium]|nr:polysaccharide deacetylase family protein [Bacillota bacterium]